MQNIIYTLNEIGKRENLEDAISPYRTGKESVFVVCDGVGGNNFGEVASQKAVESFYQTLNSQYINVQHLTAFKKCIGHSLFKFTTILQDFINEHPTGKNASSTLTAVLLKDRSAFLAWCGDSRIYHIRNGEILFRTRDHSLVQELVDNNVISEKEAANHPQKNVITKSLHAKTEPDDIQVHEIRKLEPGDFILLCTDGLLEQCTEEKLRQILVTPANGTNSDYKSVINQICTGKTHDNYSMMLISLAANQKKRKWALLITVLLLSITGLFLLMKPQKKGENKSRNMVNDTLPVKAKQDSVPKRSNFKSGIHEHQKDTQGISDKNGSPDKPSDTGVRKN